MIVISIGLIKARIDNAKKIVKDLKKSIIKPDRIIFYISKEPWLLDEGIETPPKINYPKVEFKYVKNIGPLRRVAPIVEEYIDKPNTKIILLDDDRKVPKKAIKILVDYSNEHPDYSVGYRGYMINKDYTREVNYKKRKIIQAWEINKPVKVDVINGGWFNLVKPKFFHEGFIKWQDYLDFGVDRSDESFIAYSLAKKGTSRYVIPFKSEFKDYPTFGTDLYFCKENRVAKLKQQNTWYNIIKDIK